MNEKKTEQSSRTAISFRYRLSDSANGVTRDTVRRLAEHLGVDETQVIHMALRAMAFKHLPQYGKDDGPLAATQLRQIRSNIPQDTERRVRTSLLEW